ncbi:MAG: ABC transporter permease subunit, partial [Methanobacteriota archaeon]
TVRFAMDVMSGIPSIVIGIFVYTLVLTLNRQFVFSAVSGGVALAVIMLPVVARTSEEALRLVPVTTREAALALGIPKFKVTLRVVLASARGGLVTGGLLAVARAAGETAPLIMTAFGNPFGFQGFDHPIASLTFVIFYYGTSAYENWQGLAWGATLILILIMLAISIAARIALRSRFGSRENA